MSDRYTPAEALDLLVDSFDEELDGWSAIVADAAAEPARRHGVRGMPSLRRATRIRVALLVAGVAAAATLIVTSPWETTGPAGISDAQAAAILKRTQAALAFRPGQVLHLRTQIMYVLIPVSWSDRKVYERVEIESWLRMARPYDSRSLLTYGSERLESGMTFAPCGFFYFDSPTARLYRDNRTPSDACRSAGYEDPAMAIRRDLAAGKLEVVGSSVIRSKSVYRIQESPKYRLVDHDTTITYVDAHTYQPVRFEWDEPGALASARYRTIRNVRDFFVWEYLPSTTANLALTDIRRMHPGARIASLDSLPLGPTRDLIFSVGRGGVPKVP